jgi:hypothetical protein
VLLTTVLRWPNLSALSCGMTTLTLRPIPAGYDPRAKTPRERVAELRRQREAICTPEALRQFMAARLWLRGFAKTKAQDKYGSSYGLKHVAQSAIGYTTNGAFIAAAIAEGFIVRRIWRQPERVVQHFNRAREDERRSKNAAQDAQVRAAQA